MYHGISVIRTKKKKKKEHTYNKNIFILVEQKDSIELTVLAM